MLTYAEEVSSLEEKTLILIQMKWNNLRTSELNNTISRDEAEREKAKIANSILDTIENLQEEKNDP